MDGVFCLTTEGGLYPGGGRGILGSEGGLLVIELAAEGPLSFSSETTCTVKINLNLVMDVNINVRSGY